MVTARPHVGFEHRGPGAATSIEPPQPAITLMIDLGAPLESDGGRLPSAWFGGASLRSARVALPPGYATVDVKLTPLGAYRVLGEPLSEIWELSVAVEELFAASGRQLVDEVRTATSWTQRFASVDAFLARRLGTGPVPSPAVELGVARLMESRGRARIDGVAREAGYSPRRFAQKFRAETGFRPKAFARLARFQAVCAAIVAAPAGWADVAAEAGYYDQAHLNHDFRELAGCTPAAFVARAAADRSQDVAFFQDARAANA